MLTVGDPVPWFVARSASAPALPFATVGGRYVVLSVFGSAARDDVRTMLSAIKARTEMFDGAFAAFYGVSTDPEDERSRRVLDNPPGFHVLWDAEAKIADACGLIETAGSGRSLRPASFILDPNLRVVAALPIAEPMSHGKELLAAFGAVLRQGVTGAVALPAPVLVVPRVFERDFCQRLVAAYLTGPSAAAGEGERVRRREGHVSDEELQGEIRARIVRRLLPEIAKAFQYTPTRIERFMIASYDSRDGGHVRAHRDNILAGTQHRRFAATINLNAEDYDGGDLRFPEFDARNYRAPTGAAIVYSCSLMHEVAPVTRGTRMAFLPFLYDEAGEKIRQAYLEAQTAK